MEMCFVNRQTGCVTKQSDADNLVVIRIGMNKMAKGDEHVDYTVEPV